MRGQKGNVVCLGNGDSALFVAPDMGGRLMRWRHRGEEILHWPERPDWSSPIQIRGGNPLLFPFIGRHFVDGVQGRWRDAQGRIRELPQHGFAHQLPFEVTSFEAGRAITMALRDTPATRVYYPFGFEFAVEYRLLEDGLETTITVTHRAGQEGADVAPPMPFYAGHHFYFAVPRAQRCASLLRMPPAWTSRQQPDGRLADLKDGITQYRLDDPMLQDCYHVLKGPGAAHLTIPACAGIPHGRQVRIEVDGAPDPWYAITTWTERSGDTDFYCIEPWMGLADAIHHQKGLHLLAPGETKSAVCRLIVQR
ncbi:aldose epimerase [Ralstonia sp.]|uniref:aldose epimerase family protein n=1 Tax=Ralstonia sp. TaxID=54061 RepID=UPI0031E00DEA